MSLFRRTKKRVPAEREPSKGLHTAEKSSIKEEADPPVAVATGQMLNNGEVTVRCDPSQVLTGLETTHGGKQDRLGITQHRSALPSALAMIDTIPAGQASACVDKSMLTRTGKMADNQATFSPLQGTARAQTVKTRPQHGRVSAIGSQLTFRPSMTGTVAQKLMMGEKEVVLNQAEGPKRLLSEIGNLSMDMHTQWLDVFTVSPIPSLVLSMAIGSQVLLANTACVTILGRESSILCSRSLEDVIGAEHSTSCTSACSSGLAFLGPQCTVQVGNTMHCTPLFIPISDVCTPGTPQCYLVLLLDSFGQKLCETHLASLPSHLAVNERADAPPAGWRKAMFSTGEKEAHGEHYNQGVGILSGYAEAMQRRLKGMSLGVSMPSQFDVQAWISRFEKLLTVVL